jgi:hypothetical protein
MQESKKVAMALHDLVQTLRERVDELELDEDSAQSLADGLETTCRKYVGIEPVPHHMDGREALAFLDEALSVATSL